ncbi:unnamed protein product [Staurois parvus]|uniref:Uncharacterized protein n=1 Tax=Staurois parvus TaxID=386267 RepID=A0ABN9GGX3_9NEOB|nr:unnamed protein product [Staurois parvus]
MTDPRSRRTNHKAQVLLAHAYWAPGCHAKRRHYRSRKDSARLDRGTGKIKEQLRRSKSGYLSNSGTRSPPPPPQRSAVISCTVRSLWSSLCCPLSLVIPVLSAVSGHPCMSAVH